QYIQGLADAINSIDPDRLNRILKGLSAFAIGAGGLIVGRKLFQLGRWASTPLRRAAGAGGVGVGMLPGGVQKVYVVNMRPGGGMGAPVAPGERGARRGGRSGKLGKLGKLGALGVLSEVGFGAAGAYIGAQAIDSA